MLYNARDSIFNSPIKSNLLLTMMRIGAIFENITKKAQGAPNLGQLLRQCCASVAPTQTILSKISRYQVDLTDIPSIKTMLVKT